MATTETQFEEALITSINATDSTYDTTQGPIPDLMIRPQAGQLASVSQQAQDLRTLFTLQFPSVATSTEIQQALSNFGSAPGTGKAAVFLQYFMRFSTPTYDVPIPTGALVSNQDGSLTYRVISGVTMTVANASTFFNPSRNAYEVAVLVEATGTGTVYNLPAYRINAIITSIPGIDSVENRDVAQTLGEDAETSSNQSTRLINALKGINLGSPNGLINKITNSLASEISDVNIIQPYAEEFTRITSGPALDVYVIGTNLATQTDTFTAISNQTVLVLSKVPAVSVTSLTINGVSGLVGYTLVTDSSVETGLSLQSHDIIVLDTPLVAGDVVVVQYVYNQALADVNSVVFSAGQSYLFNTDMLIRSPFPVYPVISGTVRILPSYSIPDQQNAIANFNTTELNSTFFRSSLLYEQYRQSLLSSVPGIQSLTITEFHRKLGSLATVENIYLAGNEVLVEDTTLINLKVVT